MRRRRCRGTVLEGGRTEGGTNENKVLMSLFPPYVNVPVVKRVNETSQACDRVVEGSNPGHELCFI